MADLQLGLQRWSSDFTTVKTKNLFNILKNLGWRNASLDGNNYSTYLLKYPFLKKQPDSDINYLRIELSNLLKIEDQNFEKAFKFLQLDVKI